MPEPYRVAIVPASAGSGRRMPPPSYFVGREIMQDWLSGTTIKPGRLVVAHRLPILSASVLGPPCLAY